MQWKFFALACFWLGIAPSIDAQTEAQSSGEILALQRKTSPRRSKTIAINDHIKIPVSEPERMAIVQVVQIGDSSITVKIDRNHAVTYRIRDLSKVYIADKTRQIIGWITMGLGFVLLIFAVFIAVNFTGFAILAAIVYAMLAGTIGGIGVIIYESRWRKFIMSQTKIIRKVRIQKAWIRRKER